mmetsp:Transcript_29307/g.62298  ORF Transcript_29307/g.62298 Transcript_29307/m.62298 type:complete len:272 (-) Transcript_29307:61-876(-)
MLGRQSAPASMKCCISTLLIEALFVAEVWSLGINFSTNRAERPQDDLVSLLQHAAYAGQSPLTQSSFMISVGNASETMITYALLFPDLRIEVTLDRESHTLKLEGPDVTLTEEALSELRKLLVDMHSVNGSQTVLQASRQDQADLEGLALWLSEGAAGTVLSQSMLERTNATSVSCLTVGEKITVEWSDSKGRHSKDVVVGSELTYEGQVGDYSCMGMCGPGCNGKRYTRDCLLHDTCSFYRHSDQTALGGTDPNCGKFWWNAADDYVFGC